MAEILICARTVEHPDPAKDRRGCWKPGYPVTVQPDGHLWGSRECLPRFWVLALPGVSVAEVEEYIEPQWEIGPVNPQPYRRRKWQLLVDEMPPGLRAKMDATGRLTIRTRRDTSGAGRDTTWSVLRGYLYNHVTGKPEERNR